jgi:AraC family transcriptional regulator
MDKGWGLMDNLGQRRPDQLLSAQVRDTHYCFPLLAPPHGLDLAVNLVGREHCLPEYLVRRRSFAYHGVELVAEGQGSVILDGVRHELRAGSVFAYAPTTRLEITCDPAAPLLKYFVSFGGRRAKPVLAEAGLPVGSCRTLAASAELVSVVEDLIREGRRPQAVAREICRHLLEVLLLKISATATWSPGAGDPAQDNFLRCKAIIDAETETLMSLQQIADRVGLEQSSICRLFRRFQGTSPYQYLLRRKMTIAAEFLVEGGGLVKEAAQKVGFADPYHFSRCFKAVHGVAPRDLQHRRFQVIPDRVLPHRVLPG